MNEGEFRNVGVSEAGPNAPRTLELTDAHLGWVNLAKGMGVEVVRVETTSAFRQAFKAALSQPGPSLIEAII